MKLGMVLEGGGMRGMYTAGVLDFLMERNFYPDGVIGVSAGAVHGCSYASHQRGRSYRINTKYSGNWHYMSFRSLLLTGDYFGAEFAYHKIPDELEPFDYETYDAFRQQMPLYVTVTDVETGKAEYKRLSDIHEGVEWVRASASMPIMAGIVTLEGRKYLDGGVGDSIPLRFMRKNGFDKNIVVLTQVAGYRKEPNRMMPLIGLRYEKKYPEFVRAMASRHIRYNKTLDKIQELEAAGEVFVLRPSRLVPISRIEKNVDKINEIYRLGYQDAENSYEAMLRYAGR